ncbi:MAG: hypothetical protein JSS68_07440 [Actinobacteria bacterium]|nr:hypothetical protein [Actinomycetota bacterium]MBS1883064.1 hypothetical protein [Actinomycetota bacterium]
MSEPTAPGRGGDELLARLLGPGTPELTCEECFEVLDAYVELAIAAEPADERVPGMRAHLEGCPACTEEYHSLRALLAPEEGGGPR